MISISALLIALVYVIVAALVVGLLYWLVEVCELKDPWRKVARVILAVTTVVILIGILLNMIGHPIFRW